MHLEAIPEAKFSIGQRVLCRHKGAGFIFWGAIVWRNWTTTRKTWHYRVLSEADGDQYYQDEQTILRAE